MRFVYRANCVDDRKLLEAGLGVDLADNDQVLSAMAVDGSALAVIAFCLVSARECEVLLYSAKGKGWSNRRFWRVVFGYAFSVSGLHRITLKVRTDNVLAIKLVSGLGFVREGLLREAAVDGCDLIIFGMIHSECRWLDVTQERQKRRQHSAGIAGRPDCPGGTGEPNGYVIALR